MQANLECIYKGIKETKAGSFTNEEGKTINYNEFYKVRFDQLIDGLPRETEAKINKTLALNVAKNFSLYDKIVITFDIIYYNPRLMRISVNNIRKI